MKPALFFCWLFLSYHVVREVPGGRPQDAKVEWQKLNEQCTWSFSATWQKLTGTSDARIFGCRPVPGSQLVASSCARRPLSDDLSPSSRCRLTDAYMHEEKSYEREGGSSTFVDLHERLIIAGAEEMKKECKVPVDRQTFSKLWNLLKSPLTLVTCSSVAISMSRSLTFLTEEADGHQISEKVSKVLADLSGEDGLKMNKELEVMMPKCRENKETCAKQITNVLTKTLSPSTADSSSPFPDDIIDKVVTQLMGKDDQVPASGTSQLQVLSNKVAVFGDAPDDPGEWVGFGLGVGIGVWAMSALLAISANLICLVIPVVIAGLAAGMSLVWLYRAVVRGLSSIIRQFAALSSGSGGALVQKIQDSDAAAEEEEEEEEGTKCSLADYQAADMEGASNNDPDKGAEAAVEETGSQEEVNQALPATTLTSTETDAENQHGSNVLE